jgi:hypothetical protein
MTDDIADDMWDDEDRAVLAHLAPEVLPPADLEPRVLAAAQDRRPARADEVAVARKRRSRGRIVVAGIAVAAVIAAAILVIGNRGTSSQSSRLEPAAASRPDVDAALQAPGSRVGTFPNRAGRVVLATNGHGYLYDLTPTGPLRVTIDTGTGTVDLGAATPQSGIIAFRVEHPESAPAVIVTDSTGQSLQASLSAR